MAKEIERKFLVNSQDYRKLADNYKDIRQGYLSTDKERTVRIRTIDKDAFITIKSKNQGCTRNEYEYSIPFEDAMEMLDNMCIDNIIVKRRYYVKFNNNIWEIDEFKGHLEGLVVAEIELKSADQEFDLPSFIDKEVTGDPQYYNSQLSNRPK